MENYVMSNCLYRDENGDIFVKEHSDALPPIHTVSDTFMNLHPSTRDIAFARIYWMWPEWLSVFPESKLTEIIYGRYQIDSPHKLTLSMLADLIELFRSTLLTVPRRSA
jgi:hypothetical protein